MFVGDLSANASLETPSKTIFNNFVKKVIRK